ncbi:MAG: type II secretion system F family protein [Acetobacteraceae bacterium]
MSRSLLLWAAVATIMVVLLAGIILLRQLERQRRLAVRVQMCRGIAPASHASTRQVLGTVWRRFIATLGQVLLRSGLVSAKTRAELELTLASAGLRGSSGLELFIGGKVTLLIGLPLLALVALQGVRLSSIMSMCIVGGAGIAGLLLPDVLVRYRRRRYLKRVESSLPDALDLLVICTQAGLGLTTAITRVAQEMQTGRQEVGTELAITASELQLIGDSRTALLNMGSRTGIEGLGRLGTTLVQSIQYGTPLSQALRALSAEMRLDMLTQFETRAARLGVLLTLPMILFILPCVFLVVGGPAAVQVFRTGG